MDWKKEKWFLIGFILLFVLSRFLFLDLRVLHHDEGVNYSFARGILAEGIFDYNPLNYHGPFYFFLLALSFLFFGINEFGLRFPVAFFGVLLGVFPLFFWKGRGIERYAISAFLLLSPSVFYYSRYSIHEIAFVFFSLTAVFSFCLVLERKSLNFLPLFSVSLAFLFILKETVLILLLVFFVLGVVNWKRIKGLGFNRNWNFVLFSVVLFVFVYVLFFSWFGLSSESLGNSFKGFFPWTERGFVEKGHDKPFYYYGILLGTYELPILLFGIFAIYLSFKEWKSRGFERKNLFALNFTLWFVSVFLVYSLIPYKTPWLVINMVVPLCFLAGIGVERIKGKRMWILFSAGLVYLLVASVYVNYVDSWGGEKNEFAYVHTDQGVLELVEEIELRYSGEEKILVVSDKYWPLPFYFDGKYVDYLNENKSIGYERFKEYDYLILRDRVWNSNLEDFEVFDEVESSSLRKGIELVLVERRS